jgi:DNA-binding transcriptional MerR regulator
MATLPQVSEQSQSWSKEAFAMAAHAKVLSGNKLEQLVVRLQRHSGRPKETCWRFLIQHGLKDKMDHRRWTEDEIDTLREELVKRSIEEVAKKLNRTPEAIRSTLKRNHLKLREIRCDLFSLESLAAALHVRKSEIHFWIDQNWLPATQTSKGRRRFYIITPEGLMHLYKHHHADLLKRGIANQSLFEAYVQYCYSPKHTIGEQLLDVRRDKRERAAYSAMTNAATNEEEEEDVADEDRYRIQF